MVQWGFKVGQVRSNHGRRDGVVGTPGRSSSWKQLLPGAMVTGRDCRDGAVGISGRSGWKLP